MLFTPFGARAQDNAVAGTIVAASSLRPVEHAVVTVLGTALRTETDALGRFLLESLTGPAVTIAVRRLGYRSLTQAVRVGDRRIRLALTTVAVPLDAIIVTGTAAETETRAIANDVGTIKAADVLQTAPISDVQQLLNARVPGVVIMPYEGNVGTGGATRVRGVASLSVPNEPLIYVDGIRIDNNPRAGPAIRNGPQVSRINDLNPEDIEEIQIVKGPAAATLYGTEASHGVIQILTKQGTPGRATFNMTVRQGANWFMNPAGRLNTVYARDPTTGALDSLNLYQQETAAGRPIFQTGQLQSYAASLGGGSETIRYYLSTALDDEGGMVSYNWRRRISIRANVTVAPRDNVDVKASLGVVTAETRLANAAELWDLMTQITGGSPLTDTTRLRGFFRAPPEVVATIDARDRVARFIGGVQLRHRAWGWFTQRLTIGGDVGDATSSQLFPRDPAGANGPFAGLSLGQKTVDSRQVTYRTSDYVASATFALAPALSSATSLGAQYYAKRATTLTAIGTDFPVGVTEIGGAAVTTSSSQVIENKTAGLYAQEQLGWKKRLFVTGAVRVDDNSAFGANFDYVTYPKLGASWVVSDEPFWRVGPINALRLRAAWGVAGQQPDVFAAARSYQPATGPGNVSTLTPQNIGNPDLKPERGEELELGSDVGLWNDRLGVKVTYFHQRTKDAIVPAPAAPSLGFPGTRLVNLALIRNSGIEASLDARLLNGRAVTWDLGVTLSTNDSRVESMGGIPPFTLASAGAVPQPTGQEVREGYPVGAYFYRTVVHAERDANNNIVNILCAGGPQNNNQPVACDGAPMLYAGKPTPGWEGSVRTTLRLAGNLSVTGLVDFRGGHTIIDAEIYNRHFGGNTRAINEGSDIILLAYEQLYNNGVINPSTIGLINGGFAKLREVSLTYTLPAHWAARFGARHATVTVAGRNLATLWRAQKEVFGYKVLDPEVRLPEDLNGRSFRQLPQYAQFLTAVRLTF